MSQDTIKTFTLPAIPQIMVAPEQRAEFLVKHYWDNVNFADTNYIHHPEITEQAWVDYCDILNHVPLKTAQEAIRKTIDRTNVDKKVFAYITDLADKYLYDPNSPMRNEEFYIPVLEAMAASPVLEEIERVRPKARLELAQKNRIGTKAINFTYTLASGAQGSLYQLNADYLLLFINNPGCHACTETIEGLKQAPIISQLIKEKKLIDRSRVTDIEEISGNGVTAKVDGKNVAAGNAKLMERLGVDYIDCHSVGTIVHVAVDGKYAGHILICDMIKPTTVVAKATCIL